MIAERAQEAVRSQIGVVAINIIDKTSRACCSSSWAASTARIQLARFFPPTGSIPDIDLDKRK